MLRVKDSRELQAAVLSMKRAPKEVRSIVGKDTRRVFGKEWAKEVRRQSEAHPGANQRRKLLRSGVNVTGNNPPTATVYAGRKTLSGGLGTDWWHAVEYGGDRPQLPPRSRRFMRGNMGYSFTPAMIVMAPRVAAFWVQSIVRAYARAGEGDL